MALFKKATKENVYLRINIDGPSGAGKTFTALNIASELVKLMLGVDDVPDGKIAVGDTERGSASLYSDKFCFDVCEIGPPYAPARYIEVIQEAAKSGYLVVILDSLSHGWNAEGGMLDMAAAAAKRMNSANTFAGWKDATPEQNKLVNAITSTKIHIITTMRSKMDYVLDEVDNGKGGTKKVPRKIGLAPVQRNDMEYEYTVVLDMDLEHTGIIGKTRCDALRQGVFHYPGRQIAEVLFGWMKNPDGSLAKIAPTVKTRAERIGELWDRTKTMFTPTEWKLVIQNLWNVQGSAGMTEAHLDEWADLLRSMEAGSTRKEDVLPQQVPAPAPPAPEPTREPATPPQSEPTQNGRKHTPIQVVPDTATPAAAVAPIGDPVLKAKRQALRAPLREYVLAISDPLDSESAINQRCMEVLSVVTERAVESLDTLLANELTNVFEYLHRRRSEMSEQGAA